MKSIAALLVFAVLVSVVQCRPDRRFLEDCKNFACPEDYSPVCGSDGVTYSNACSMEMVNKRRMCFIGHFNMVTQVKEGRCEDTVTKQTTMSSQ